MTQEQLEFFTEQTERAAEKASKRGYEAALKQARLGFALLLIGIGAVFYLNQKDDADARTAIVDSGRAVSVSGCNRDYEDRVKFVELLLRGKAAVLMAHKTGQQTEAQRDRGLEFYDRQLKDYTLIDCRKSEDVVSDDPDAVADAPAPYWPGEITAPNVQVPPGVTYEPTVKPENDNG